MISRLAMRKDAPIVGYIHPQYMIYQNSLPAMGAIRSMRAAADGIAVL